MLSTSGFLCDCSAHRADGHYTIPTALNHRRSVILVSGLATAEHTVLNEDMYAHTAVDVPLTICIHRWSPYSNWTVAASNPPFEENDDALHTRGPLGKTRGLNFLGFNPFFSR